MTEDTFKDLCLCGETTKVQFKESFTSQKEIAKEMIAFANTKGGVILFGVEYLQKVYATTLDGFGGKAEQVLKNIHILNHHGVPTLAGYLFFGKHPEYNCPTCMVKAVSFFGNALAGTQYRDSKEILGNMPQLYNKSMAFLKANLHNVQEEGASFNTLGKLEIAEEVLEEVVQNALVHRDLLRPAPIRLFVFDNRVEVISPGALAGGLTEEDIRNGKTYQRNPYMATFATNALYYKGIGSGIVRILAEYPNIRLENDVNGKEFKVTIPRTIQKSDSATQKEQLEDISTTQKREIATQKSEIATQKNLDTTQKEVLEYFKGNPKATRVDAANALGNITEDGVKFIIAKLQKKGLLKRVGGRKHGEWQVLI